jgi:hypothetical protein
MRLIVTAKGDGGALLCSVVRGGSPFITMLAAWRPARRRAAELPSVEAIRHEAAALGRKAN